MSKSVDQRVVQMEFDNKQFESGASTTLKTLSNLKDSLNFTGAVKGLNDSTRSFSDIQSAANSTAESMGTFGDSVEDVGSKFNVLQTIATGVCSRIGAVIGDMIVNVAQSVTSLATELMGIQSIKDGFAEYETQINSVQTILSNTRSKGTTIDQVNEALDELNTYADQTIYNFTEMTRNIGTFTAAGIDLDTSVSSIKGIANLAAVSGSTSYQASTAMYQLSQALAAGTVKLQDWNSVVNAGMGGQVFQDALKETARVIGIDIDSMIEKAGSFRETLQYGWLTADVLTETLGKFAGAYSEEELRTMGYTEEEIKNIIELGEDAIDAATKVKTFTQLIDTLKEAVGSGWTQTWELIIGDYEEAKEMWTQVSDYFSNAVTNMSNARNEIVEKWANFGGRDILKTGIVAAFNALLNLARPIKEAFNDIFPAVTWQTLLKITASFRDFTRELKNFTKNISGYKSTFSGIFAAINIVVQAVKALASGFNQLAGPVIGAAINAFFSVTGNIGEYVVKLNSAITAGDIFNKAVSKVVTVVKSAASAIKDFASKVSASLSPYLTFVDPIRTKFEGLFNTLLDYISNFDTSGFDDFANSVKATFQPVNDLISNINFSFESFGETVRSVLNTVKGYLSSAWQVIKNVFSSIKTELGNTFSAVTKVNWKDFIGGMSIGAIIKWSKELIDTITETVDKVVSTPHEKITSILDGVKDSLTEWQTNLKANRLIALASAIAILAGALLTLSKINGENLFAALTAMTAAFAEIIAAQALLEKFVEGSKGSLTLNIQMLATAEAVNILASAFVKFGSLDWDQVAKASVAIVAISAALLGLTVAISELTGGDSGGILEDAADKISKGAQTFLKSAGKSLKSLFSGLSTAAKSIGVGVMMVGIATAVLELVAAVTILGNLPIDKVVQGTTAVVLLIAALGIFAKGMNSVSPTSILATAVSVQALVGAITALSAVVVVLGLIDLETLKQGLVGVGVAMAELYAASELIKPDKMTGAAAGVLALAAGLAVIAAGIAVFGSMDISTLVQGAASVTFAIVALAAAAKSMDTVNASSAEAMILIAGALTVLAVAMKLFGTIDIISLAKGLVSLAAAVAVFAGISYLLTEFGDGLNVAATAMIKFAASVALIAVAAKLLSTTSDWIIANGEKMGTALATVAEQAIRVVVDSLLGAKEQILSLVDEYLAALAEHAPSIVESIWNILVTICSTLAEKLPELINVTFGQITTDNVLMTSLAMAAVVKLLQGLFTAGEQAKKAALSLALLTAVIVGLTSMFSVLAGIPTATLTTITLDVSALIVTLTAVLAALQLIPVAGAITAVASLAIFAAGVTALIAALGLIYNDPLFGKLIDSGLAELEALGNGLGRAVGAIVSGCAQVIAEGMPLVAQNLSDFMTKIQPFIDGADGLQEAASATLTVGEALIKIGKARGETTSEDITGFAEDLSGIAPALEAFGESMANVDIDGVEKGAKALTIMAEAADAIPNTGGLLGDLVGNNDLGYFGEQLEAFGPKLASFSDSVKDVDVDAVSGTATVITTFASAAKEIPNTGGLLADIVGDNNLSDFADALSHFGSQIHIYGYKVDGLDIDSICDTSEIISTFATVAQEIPNSGGLLGTIVGDNDLGSFGEALGTFGANLKTYYTDIKGVDIDHVISSAAAISTIARAIDLIPGKDGLGDTTWFGNYDYIGQFAASLASAGPDFKTFAESVEGLNSGNVVTAATSITDIANALNAFDANVLDSSLNLADFGTDLKSLGESLNEFDDAVKDIHLGWIAQGISAIKNIAGAMELLPKSLSDNGSTGLRTFGEELASFGPNLQTAVNAVGDVNILDVNKMVSAVTRLASMATVVTDETVGIKNFISGYNALSNFGTQLALFGPSFASFVSSIQDTRDYIAQVRRACTAVEDIASRIIPVLPDESNSNLSHFGEELEGFGVSMTIFLSGLKSVSVDDLEAAITQFERLAEMADVDYTAFNDFSAALATAGETGVTSFVSAFQNGSEKVKAVVRSFIAAAISVLTEDVKLFKKQGSSHMSNYITGMKDKINDVKAAVTTIVSTAVTALVGKSDTFKTYGTGLASALASGITAGQTTVTNAVNSLLKSASTAASNSASTFTTVGKQISNGLAKGVTANTSAVVKASASAVKAAEKAAKKQAQIKSPSRVFAKLGMYMSLGMAKGISDYSDDAATASASAATTAAKAFSNSVAGLSASISDNMDTSPTIRPVLDLSGVESGTQYLDRMLSGRTLTINGIDAQSYASSFDRRYIQNGSQTTNQATSSSNDQIIRTINNIGERLDQLGQQMTNMKVVMDTGATVGQLETTIDKRLGVLAGYRERRL